MFIDKKNMLISAFAGKLFSEDDGKINPGVLTYLQAKEYDDALLSVVFGNFNAEYKVHDDHEALMAFIESKTPEEDREEFDASVIPDNIQGELLLVYPLDEALSILREEIASVKKRVSENRGQPIKMSM